MADGEIAGLSAELGESSDWQENLAVGEVDELKSEYGELSDWLEQQMADGEVAELAWLGEHSQWMV